MRGATHNALRTHSLRYITWRRWAFVAVLAVLLAPSRAFAAGQMVTLETPHYNIQTDISPAFAQLVAKHMEAIFLQYARPVRWKSH